MALSRRSLITKTGISTTQVFDMGGINIPGGDFNLGSNIKLGNASGIITATTFVGNFTGNPTGSGANLTNLPAAQLTGTLPAISGANLTNLDASDLASGTVPDARFPATLPAISGANLTNLDASDLASGTVPTARLGSGTANNTTFLRGDSTFQTVNTDLVSDTSPQLGGNLDVNTKNIVFGDSGGATDDRLTFGAGTDLSIYHSGSHNFIDITNGQLRIRHGTDNAIKTIADGAAILYFDGGQRIQTTTGGIEISGETVASSHIKIADNGKLKLGTGEDLEIWHNGGTGNSNVKQQTGDLYFYTGTDLNMLLRDGTSVDLYYANSKKLETITSGVKVTGGLALAASSGNDPVINNADGGSGNNMYFQTGGAYRLIIQSDGHTRPASDNTYDLGTANDRWRNLYTTDLQLSNEGSANDVDGTWGNYTIQEGESDLFLINNRSGKKYKFNLTEVS